MDKDVEVIKNVLFAAIEERKREQHKARMADKVSLIGGNTADAPRYISAEQRMSVMQLLMEFYRIVHRDQPSVSASQVSSKFLNKYKINSFELLTVERFDEIVFDLLDAINSYHDSSFDGDAIDYADFQTEEVKPNFRFLTAKRTQRNITTYILGDFEKAFN